jgi:hypothetical protein
VTPSRSLPVFVIVFAVAYPIAYVVAVMKNYALFTYHPALEEFALWVERPKEGPAMYWYGWIATSVIAALVAGLVASVIPERLAKRLWSGWSWMVPLGVMLVFGYLLRGYFTS